MEVRSSVWDRRAFTVGDREYLLIDVLLAAMWRGEWAAFEQRLREGLACENYSYDTDDPADQDAVELATNEFRYDHELITADETEAWLEKVGLSVESWSRYFAREHLWTRWQTQLEEVMAAGAPTDEAVADDVLAEGVSSGAFRRFSTAMAGRAAIYADRSTSDGSEPFELDAEKASQIIDTHRRLFPGVSDDEYQERLSHLAQLEAVFERARIEALTEEALEAQVETSRLDWLLVDIERLPFAEASMVRETRLCCQEDDLTLSQLAARINRLVLREKVRLEECAAELRGLLLSAEPGELLGPFAVDDGFQALVVRAKYLPDTQDPEVRELAESAVISALEQRARVLHVRWHQRY